MPKKYRLSGEEIRNLSSLTGGQAGKRLHGRLFSLLVAPVPGDNAKCACVVSKKAAAKAVDRNKIKRRCRAVLAKRVADVKKPVALVLYAKREAKDATFSEIERDISTLLVRATTG
jgi:ribonuclease P protein component